MKNNKLIKLYRNLSNLERKHFSAFVASPFFNKKVEIIRLCAHLEAAAPRFAPAQIEKKTVFTAVYGQQAYDDQMLRLCASDLIQLLNKFLSYQTFSELGSLPEILLLRNLGTRDLDKHFQYVLRKARQIQNKQESTDPEVYLQRYLLEAELGRYAYQNPRKQEPNQQTTIGHLDVFYLIQKLKTACSILNNQYVVDLDYDILFMDAILAHLETTSYDHVPLISIYYQALLMFRLPDEEIHFQQLTSLLARHQAEIPPPEARDAYTFAQNYCIRQINRGKSAFMQELFQIYQQLLEQKLLLDDGHLSPWHYKNIVALGLRLGALDWVEDFIPTYREQILPEYRANAYTYNFAKLQFHRKNYPEVKRLLLQVEYEDLFYNLDSKVMLLKIYLEEGEQEALESLTNAFGTYLDRNALVSEDHRLRYKNLVRYVRRLNLMGEDRQKLEALREEVGTEGKIADIRWLRAEIARRLNL